MLTRAGVHATKLPLVAMTTTRLQSTSSGNPVRRVVVIGSGLMGSGIVQVAATNGLAVTMVDVKQDLLDKARARIDSSLQVLSSVIAIIIWGEKNAEKEIQKEFKIHKIFGISWVNKMKKESNLTISHNN